MKIEERDIRFEPLQEVHFEYIYRWFNQSHVQAFYSLRSWTFDEVREKLTPYVKMEKGIRAYLIYLKDVPIGYIQSYPIKDHPWEGQELSEKVAEEAAGFDLFLGEIMTLRRGLGTLIVGLFLKRMIWPHYRYCFTDPDINNEASLRLFEKCGFVRYKQLPYVNALKQSTHLQLFMKEREA